MTFLYGRHFVLLLFLLLGLFLSFAVAQTLQNPAFGEELINFSGPNGDIRSTDPSDFRVAQAQVFQTVYLANNTSYRVKPLFDFRDACNESTTLDDLQRWNSNGLNTLSGIQSRSKIALVKRGGNCTWSKKVQTVTQLSIRNQLSVNVVIIYDNQTYSAMPHYTLTQATGITTVPVYPSNQLPSQVNISLMNDNDISSDEPIALNQPVTEIYYIDNDFGLDLLSIMQDSFDSVTPESNGAPSNYLFLVPVLRSFDWSRTINSNHGTPNYLSWVIALAAFFLLAVFTLFIFFRWWRRRQRREDMEYNAMLEERNLIAMQRRKLKPLPVDIVNSYPIQTYHADTVKNTTCAICLDEFEENQPDIRILPCDHGFCVLCIDPWLTQKSTLCPICKYNCLPDELRDPGDDTDHAGASPQGNTTTTATTTESGTIHAHHPLAGSEPNNNHSCNEEEDASINTTTTLPSPQHQELGMTNEATDTNPPLTLSTMLAKEKEIQVLRRTDRPSSSSSMPSPVMTDDKKAHTGHTTTSPHNQIPPPPSSPPPSSPSSSSTSTAPDQQEISPATTIITTTNDTNEEKKR